MTVKSVLCSKGIAPRKCHPEGDLWPSSVPFGWQFRTERCVIYVWQRFHSPKPHSHPFSVIRLISCTVDAKTINENVTRRSSLLDFDGVGIVYSFIKRFEGDFGRLVNLKINFWIAANCSILPILMRLSEWMERKHLIVNYLIKCSRRKSNTFSSFRFIVACDPKSNHNKQLVVTSARIWIGRCRVGQSIESSLCWVALRDENGGRMTA